MSLTGRLLRTALPLIKLRSRLRGLTLGVRAAVHDEAGRVLLVRHSYLPQWHFPGGGVEYAETILETLARELREEAGVALAGPPRLRGLYRNPEWTAGDHVAFFAVDRWTHAGWRPSLEIEAAEWFAPEALPGDVHASVRRRLAEAAGGAADELW
jgi:8-oxo-dGTP pyrophosphatase MutT (NUDIX family)